jgi:DNA-binding transcriptional ArsR family regulator
MPVSDLLSEKFQALGHPVRRAMVQTLAQGPRSVGELARPFKMTAPAISGHLKVLERAGLVSRRIEGQSRIIGLKKNAVSDIDIWIDQIRNFWDGSFDRLDDRLAELNRRRQWLEDREREHE